MSLQSSTLFSLQILNLTVKCSLLITRKFCFPMKPIYIKNNIQKKHSTCFLFFFSPLLFSYHSLLNIFICSIISALTFYIPITLPLPLRKKKINQTAVMIMIQLFLFLTFPNFCFQFLLHGGKNMNYFPLYSKIIRNYFLLLSQVWPGTSETVTIMVP